MLNLSIRKQIIIDRSIEGISFEDESSITISQRDYPNGDYQYRIKEYMSVYDPYFSVGLGWIYCSNYLTLEDAKILLNEKVYLAIGTSIVYIIDKPIK